MKKFLTLFCVFFALSALVPAWAQEQKIEATYEGEIVDGVKLYVFSGVEYFSVKDIAWLYKCTVTWHPVTGKVTLFCDNQRIDFFLKTTRISVNGKKRRLSEPIRVQKNQAYVPASYILSGEFAEFTGTESAWNPDTSILNINKKINVQSPRFYSYQQYTQIVVELEDDLPYSWSQRDPGVGVLSITRGKLNEETIGSDDGVIREIEASNKGREAQIKIHLTEGAGKIERKEQNNPKKIFITIARTALAAPKIELPVVISTSTEELFVSSPTETVPSTVVSAPETKPETIPASPAGRPAEKPEEKPEVKPVAEAVPEPAVVPAETPKKETIRVFKPAKGRKILVLDAGHGGEDPGAIGPNGTKEKEINLAIVRELKKLLDLDGNYEVVITRRDDTFIPLVDRTVIANDMKAHLFVSVHCNASIKRTSSGFEIYFLSETASDPEAQATAILENSVVRLEGKPTKKRAKIQELLWGLVVNEYINESSEICSFIGNEVCRRTKVENRGVKQAGFYVLRGAEMPAVLVECAFISHLGEESKLRNKSYQRKIADGIYEGIKRYDEKKGI